MSSPWKLKRVTDGQEYVLNRGKNTVGRSMGHTVTLPIMCVSRDHCIIDVDDGQVTVIHGPEGVNGTFVGYRQIIKNQPHILKSGDIIGFGCINRDRIAVGYENAMFKLLNADEPEAPVAEVVIELDSEHEMDVNVNNAPSNDIVELSDDENDTNDPHPIPLNDEDNRVKDNINNRNENFEEPEFVKEEYNVGDDDQIECVSDSEDDDWAARLSQSSPGKALTRRNFGSDNFEELPLDTKEFLDVVDASKTNSDVKIESTIFLDDDEGTCLEDVQFPNLEEQMEALHSSQNLDELHQNAESTPPELPTGDKIELAPAVNISVPMEKIKEDIEKMEEVSASLPETISNKVQAESVEPKATTENAPLVSKVDTAQTYVQVVPSCSGENFKLQSDQRNKNLKRTIVDKRSGLSPKRKKKGRSSIAEATGPKRGTFREERSKRLKEIADRAKAKNTTMNLESVSISKTPSASVNVKITNSNRGNFLIETEINEKKQKRKLSSDSNGSSKSERSDEDKPQTNQEPKDEKKYIEKSNTVNKSKEGNKSDNKQQSRDKSGDKDTTTVKSRREAKRRDNGSRHKANSKHRSRSKDRSTDSSSIEDNINRKSKKKDKTSSRSRKENKHDNNSREGEVSIDESKINGKNCPTSINNNEISGHLRKEEQSYVISKNDDKSNRQSKNLDKRNLEFRKAEEIINNDQKGDISNDESKRENKNALDSKNEENSCRDPREKSQSGYKCQNEEKNFNRTEARKEHISNDKSIIEHKIICDPRIHHINENSNKEEYKRKDENAPGTSSSREEYVRVNDEKRAPLRDMVPNVVPGKVKTKKSVRFSSEPKVIEFQIEQGNKMKKMSECKTINHSVHLPCERQFLAFILRWSTKWFEEQLLVNTPPDILPMKNEPMTVCHAFESYDQYERILSDLLLMELWDSLTQDYMRKRTQPHALQLRLEVPPEVSVDNKIPIRLSVNLSLPKKEPMPRMGEIMLIMTESKTDRKLQLFKHPFYVHNVRLLPAPRNNVNNFLSITLLTVNTQSLSHLQCGAVLLGKTLSYIKNELVLVEAIEQLKWSPLTPIILNPEPAHFRNNSLYEVETSQWTESLNPSQLRAVKASVGAALSKQPSIQMIQGPPGTGKSSVICSTLMSYLYRDGRRQAGRGKVLVCATSNAAVDGLVVRLLNIRQTLPAGERFRMVRVGRVESMHSRARDVSSLQLARQHALSTRAAGQRAHTPVLAQNAMELNFLEAKMNSIRQRLELERSRGTAGAPALEQRLDYYRQRMERAKLASNINEEPTAGELADAERLIIDRAEIVVTTLASVANNRIKCLADRIALCIVEEAGQAIEPETLMPLMLRVTNLTLIGDPLQLPGFINSQRAKKYGLGESLFSRLSAVTEDWSVNPVILLDVQYRMHPAIADYPNRAFYHGRVKDCAAVRPDIPLEPYTMVFIANGAQGRGECRANEMEAWGVARLAAELSVLTRQLGMDLAVITPYNAQKQMIQNFLGSLLDRESGGLEVNTVDSFQGQERDVVVVSLARSQGVGFLTDPGRINVMLTRARHALVVCLNPHALMQNNQWRSLIDDAQSRSRCIDLPSRVCRPANAETARRDSILHLLRK